MLYLGMDEAGYGPRFGPLVVSAACLMADGSFDPDECPVPVGDSKKLYTSGKGVALLERTVLSFLARECPLNKLTFHGLCKGFAGSLSSLPWYKDDFPIPVTPGQQVPARETALWLGGHRLFLRARLIEAEEINASDNKADLLFRVETELIESIFEETFFSQGVLNIGKHGSRRFYGDRLESAFALPFETIREERDQSVYQAVREGRRLVFAFLRDGEDRDFLLALASMFAKYLREGAMRLFSDYWTRRVPGLKPTAGYPADAGRFLKGILPALEEDGIPLERIYRER